MDGRLCSFEDWMSLLKSWLCIGEEQGVAGIHGSLSGCEMEEEQIRECVIQWAWDVGHGILVECWESLWARGWKFALNVYLRDNFYRMMCRWWHKLNWQRCTEICQVDVGGVETRGCFLPCVKDMYAEGCWTQVCQQMQLIFGVNLQVKPGAFLLGVLDDQIQKDTNFIFVYDGCSRDSVGLLLGGSGGAFS